MNIAIDGLRRYVPWRGSKFWERFERHARSLGCEIGDDYIFAPTTEAATRLAAWWMINS